MSAPTTSETMSPGLRTAVRDFVAAEQSGDQRGRILAADRVADELLSQPTYQLGRIA
jgi:hypothetical protein